jgi:hypothetical protein
MVDGRCCWPDRAARGSAVGSPACRLELAILVSEIWFDISWQPPQHGNCSRRNRGVLGPRRTAPKEGHMSLEVSAFHNVAEFLQTIILITKWCNQSFQRVQMVGKIFARNFSSRAKVPNSGSADDVGAVWARPISLTLPICFRWLFLNDTRDLVRFEPIASEPQRGERSDSIIRFRCRCSRGHSRTHPWPYRHHI